MHVNVVLDAGHKDKILGPVGLSAQVAGFATGLAQVAQYVRARGTVATATAAMEWLSVVCVCVCAIEIRADFAATRRC